MYTRASHSARTGKQLTESKSFYDAIPKVYQVMKMAVFVWHLMCFFHVHLFCNRLTFTISN